MAVPPATIGPKNEDIALTNWPRVNVLAILLAETTFAIIGFNDTCSIVLLIPNIVKASNILAKV